MKLYPSIDILGGKVVRLERGSFDHVKVYGEDPLAAAAAFEADGAQFIHVVDLDGARDTSKRQKEIIKRLAKECKSKIQVGGGIRSIADVQELMGLGVDRVVIGSLAVRDEEAMRVILSEFSGDRVTLALDVKEAEMGKFWVRTGGWTEDSKMQLEEVLTKFVDHGVKRVLCTDTGRDGTLEGPNLLLYSRMQSEYPAIEVQASGGISNLFDLQSLKQMGLGSAVLGRAIYEKKFTFREALEQC